MPSWGNAANGQNNQDMEAPGVHTLKVPSGLTTLGGGLEVTDIGGSEIQVNSAIHTNDTLFIEAGGESASSFTFKDTVVAKGLSRLDLLTLQEKSTRSLEQDLLPIISKLAVRPLRSTSTSVAPDKPSTCSVRRE